MLDVFYGAFSPACFALLGLWLVVVQIRLREWQGSAVHRRRSYGVALHFALLEVSLWGGVAPGPGVAARPVLLSQQPLAPISWVSPRILPRSSFMS